ncbi:MAG: ATP-binding protein [Saprospiraceae bacterium]|nr:ATP-binding protein [Saprospiraceae bacterium]
MKIENENLLIREFPSHLKNVEQVDQFIEWVKGKFELSDQKIFDIHIALTEAVNNAMIHGNYLNDEKTVILSVIRLGDTLRFTIKDEGKGFKLTDCNDPTAKEFIDKPNGRGIYLIQHLADRVTFLEKGRVVEIDFKICS